jgi:hypothetical protein
LIERVWPGYGCHRCALLGERELLILSVAPPPRHITWQVLSKLLATGVLCQLDAAAVEWHDERYKGTQPIHAATGAPTNFSALLAYVVASSSGPLDGLAPATPSACGINLVDLQVDAT